MQGDDQTHRRASEEARDRPDESPDGSSDESSDFTASRRNRRLKRLLAGALGLACVAALVAILGSALVSGRTGEGNARDRGHEGGATAKDSRPEASREKGNRSPAGGVGIRERDLPPPSKSCDDLRVLVDHRDELPAYYAPKDLVSLQSVGVPTYNEDHLLRVVAARHLREMISAAGRDGVQLFVASGYRSYADQQAAHSKWASYYGDAAAGGLSAYPGQSQHQLGTAVDFTNSETDYKINQLFGQTRASGWLKENAPDYGYALAYPRGMKSETGYGWEPWHYRYIGRENTERMKKSDLSLQKYLEAEGVRPRC